MLGFMFYCRGSWTRRHNQTLLKSLHFYSRMSLKVRSLAGDLVPSSKRFGPMHKFP